MIFFAFKIYTRNLEGKESKCSPFKKVGIHLCPFTADSKEDLANNKPDQPTSKADLAKSMPDLARSKADLARSKADLAKSKPDLFKSRADPTKTKPDLPKSKPPEQLPNEMQLKGHGGCGVADPLQSQFL